MGGETLCTYVVDPNIKQEVVCNEKGRRKIMLSDNISGINRVAELFVTLCDSTAVEVLQLCHRVVVKSYQVKIIINLYIISIYKSKANIPAHQISDAIVSDCFNQKLFCCHIFNTET